MKPKTAYIRFRTTLPRKKFLDDLVKAMNNGKLNQNEIITLSELLDAMVQYFMIQYLMGDYNKPLPELRDEFLKFLSDTQRSQK